MYVANNNAHDFVSRCINFKGNHTFGEQAGGVYRVYSYGYHFPIYVRKNGKWYANKDKYSHSTSCHQSQLKPEIFGEFTYLNTEEMKAL